MLTVLQRPSPKSIVAYHAVDDATKAAATPLESTARAGAHNASHSRLDGREKHTALVAAIDSRKRGRQQSLEALAATIRTTDDLSRMWNACRTSDRDNSGKLTPAELSAAINSSAQQHAATTCSPDRAQSGAATTGALSGLSGNAGYVDYRDLVNELKRSVPSQSAPQRVRPASARPSARSSSHSTSAMPAQPPAVRMRPASAHPSARSSGSGAPSADSDGARPNSAACARPVSAHASSRSRSNAPSGGGAALDSAPAARERPASARPSRSSSCAVRSTMDDVIDQGGRVSDLRRCALAQAQPRAAAMPQHPEVKAALEHAAESSGVQLGRQGSEAAHLHNGAVVGQGGTEKVCGSGSSCRPLSAPLRRATATPAISNPNDLTQKSKCKAARPSSASVRGAPLLPLSTLCRQRKLAD